MGGQGGRLPVQPLQRDHRGSQPREPPGLIDPISGPLGTLEYDHSDGISVTGGFVYRGTAIPELYGKYVFGDLALRNAPPRVDGRVFYADLDSGEILEFLLPHFVGNKLPNGLTVHGFGQDGNGELYALVTNTPANGTGGIVYRIDPVVPNHRPTGRRGRRGQRRHTGSQGVFLAERAPAHPAHWRPGFHEAGRYEVVWDGRSENGREAKDGLYFVRLRAGGLESRERLVLME